MADNINPSHGNQFREYKGSVGKDPAKPYNPAGSQGSDATHETAGGYASNPFIRKMFPNISEADAKKFINNLINNVTEEIRKEIKNSKERLQRLREDDQN